MAGRAFCDDIWAEVSVFLHAGREDGDQCDVGFEREIGEADVLELNIGYAVTAALVSGLCAGRVWVFHLNRVSIGKRTVFTASTFLSSSAITKDGEIFARMCPVQRGVGRRSTSRACGRWVSS